MGYTVVSMVDDNGARGSGLTLPEAFARLMGFARCSYAFGRFNGDMDLSLTKADGVSGSYATEPSPALRSKLLDGARARAEIMRRFLNHSFNGYRMITDDDWRREERSRCEREGLRPTRRIEFD